MLLLIFILGLSAYVSKGALEVLSPDVRYACKAVEGLISSMNVRCVGIACSEGVVLAAVKSTEGPPKDEEEGGRVLEQTRCMDQSSPLSFGKCIFKLQEGVHVAVSGWQADTAYLVRYLRDVCARHRSQFGTSMDAQEVAEETSRFLYTLSTEDSALRPLVVSVLVGGTVSAQSLPRHALEMDSECIFKPASRLTDACLFKIDTSGVLQEICAGITGSFVSEDLSLLRSIDERKKDASPEGTESDSHETKGKAVQEGEPLKSGGTSINVMLRRLTKPTWHDLSVPEALEAIKRDGYTVVESSYLL